MRVHTHAHAGPQPDNWSPEPRPSKGKGRRLPVVLTSWAPSLLPFITLVGLIALRSAIGKRWQACQGWAKLGPQHSRLRAYRSP